MRALDYILSQNKSLTVNLGSENGISVKEMIDTARRITGLPIPADIVGRRPGDPARMIASSGKASQLLSWKAKFSDCETLIASTWNVYKAHMTA
jgi:UDP-glucose 4-epimerase